MADIETREFPTAVVVSLSSGIALCEFSAIHEFAEFLMGHPIWTHHFADKALREAMRRAVEAQCPGMPAKLSGVTADNYREHILRLEAAYGPTQTIRKGDGSTAMSPLGGIPEGKTVIVATP